MGKGSQNNSETTVDDGSSKKAATTDASKAFFTWDEVRKHNKKGDSWVVVKDNVYDVSTFQRTHPGGSRVMNLYAGQDATEVFAAFHKEMDRVDRYSKLYHIGKIDPSEAVSARLDNKPVNSAEKEIRELQIRRDFEQIRKIATDMGLFKPSYFFFFLHALQIVFFNILGYVILWKFGGGTIPFLCAAFCHIISQGQTNWTQHDYGHSSLLAKPKYNRYIQMFFLGLIKGASSDWWNFMHNQHHAKPNVIDKDPDVRLDPIFVLGKVQPIRKAEQNVKYNVKNPYPYTFQQYYFPLAAPLLFPVYFQYMTIRYAVQRRKYADLASLIPFFIIFFGLTIPILGISRAILFFFVIRLSESAWFAWVSQCNHIVMDVHDDDANDSWLGLQLRATCNISKSAFNDWYTGHLNFQIEHHLFPTMPRHNYYKVQPLIQSLCKKYNVNYVVKPMKQAFLDILFSLKKSGEMWEEAYNELKLGN